MVESKVRMSVVWDPALTWEDLGLKEHGGWTLAKIREVRTSMCSKELISCHYWDGMGWDGMVDEDLRVWCD